MKRSTLVCRHICSRCGYAKSNRERISPCVLPGKPNQECLADPCDGDEIATPADEQFFSPGVQAECCARESLTSSQSAVQALLCPSPEPPNQALNCQDVCLKGLNPSTVEMTRCAHPIPAWTLQENPVSQRQMFPIDNRTGRLWHIHVCRRRAHGTAGQEAALKVPACRVPGGLKETAEPRSGRAPLRVRTNRVMSKSLIIRELERSASRTAMNLTKTGAKRARKRPITIWRR